MSAGPAVPVLTTGPAGDGGCCLPSWAGKPYPVIRSDFGTGGKGYVMGDIGTVRRRVDLEPIEAPEELPAPVEPATPEPAPVEPEREPVPA